jgi:hypothetical protein
LKPLDKIVVYDVNGEEHSIELWLGDITTISEMADILVISAFPGDYYPTRTSLIGSLFQRGISVKNLAQDKFEDMRENSFCWISQQLPAITHDSPYKRLICYEPPHGIHPADGVGNIFRCLAAYAGSGHEINTIMMPLISTGDAGIPIAEMLEPLLEAATHWMKSGLPIRRLIIVEKDEHKALEIKGAFGVLRKIYQSRPNLVWPQPSYDAFISYCHANKTEADFFHQELTSLQSDIKLFIDRQELIPGMAWQKKIFNSLVSCRKVIALYSPQYIKSQACREEFNLAQVLHHQRKNVLFPIYLYDIGELPPSMSFWQYTDCRPADQMKLKEACSNLIQDLDHTNHFE